MLQYEARECTSTWCNSKGSGGSKGAPPRDQIVLNFMQFFKIFDKNHMLAAPAGGLAPLPTEILDAPLNCFQTSKWKRDLMPHTVITLILPPMYVTQKYNQSTI